MNNHMMYGWLVPPMIIVIILLLSGCTGFKPASVGGECKVFDDDPGFAVQGKRLKDKQWIGRVQEKGIEICGWKRPTT